MIEAEVRGAGFTYTVGPLPRRRRSRWVLVPLTVAVVGWPELLAAVLIYGVL